MQQSGIFGYLDIAQLTLYAFWVFFAGLVYYLRSEDKREGYPLHTGKDERLTRRGFPPLPHPKIFRLADGRTVSAPRVEAPEGAGNSTAMEVWEGSARRPNGDPMADGVGPAAYAQRADLPDLLSDGHIKIVPLRVATEHSLATEGLDPRGMEMIAADHLVAGVVRDAWIDLAEMTVRYLEVEVAGGGGRVLLPMPLAKVHDTGNRVTTGSVLAHQFAAAPKLANPDQVTLREEDRIGAYFASGYLFATPDRSEPLL